MRFPRLKHLALFAALMVGNAAIGASVTFGVFYLLR